MNIGQRSLSNSKSLIMGSGFINNNPCALYLCVQANKRSIQRGTLNEICEHELIRRGQSASSIDLKF